MRDVGPRTLGGLVASTVRTLVTGVLLFTAGGEALAAPHAGERGTPHPFPADEPIASRKPNPDPGHLKAPSGEPALGGGLEPMILVFPRGQAVVQRPVETYRDIDNVQWALDNVASDGEVRLMTTDPDDGARKAFYFGDDVDGREFVVLGRPVTVAAEQIGSMQALASPQGTLLSDRATVYGGGGTAYLDGVFSIRNEGKTTVDGIRFDNSGAAAIHLGHCDGADIKNNVITNVRPKYSPDGGVGFGFGIQVNGIFGDPGGDIDITHNEMDLYGPDDTDLPDAVFFGAGVGVSDTVAVADIHIEHNTIHNPGATGIWLAGFENSEIWVDHNTIYQRAAEGSYGYDWGNGISVYSHPAPWWTWAGTAHLTDNEIYGIVVDWSVSAIQLECGNATGCSIEGNHIEGYDLFGIFLWGTREAIVQDNDYDDFACYFPLYLDGAWMDYPPTEWTTVIEPGLTCDDITDHGEHNTIVAGGQTCE